MWRSWVLHEDLVTRYMYLAMFSPSDIVAHPFPFTLVSQTCTCSASPAPVPYFS